MIQNFESHNSSFGNKEHWKSHNIIRLIREGRKYEFSGLDGLSIAEVDLDYYGINLEKATFVYANGVLQIQVRPKDAEKVEFLQGLKTKGGLRKAVTEYAGADKAKDLTRHLF